MISDTDNKNVSEPQDTSAQEEPSTGSGQEDSAQEATGNKPAEEESPAEEEAPAEEKAPAEEEAPVEEEAPAKEGAKAKETLKEETSKKETKAEEAPAQEEAPAKEEAPTKEEAKAKETPKEETSKKETKAEEAPAKKEAPTKEEAKAKETPKEETSKKEAKAKETPKEEASKKEAKAKEAPKEEISKKEAKAKETPKEEASKEEDKAKETPKEEASKEEAKDESQKDSTQEAGDIKPLVQDDGKNWFVLRVMSGKERKLRDYLENEMNRSGWDKIVTQILVPTEKVFKVVKGKKVTQERNFFPGYILIEADTKKLNGDILQAIRSVTGVINFLGGNKPNPIRQAEVNRILGKVDEMQEAGETLNEPFIMGETIKIIDGPFSDFNGNIEEVYEEKKKLKVIVLIFGRKTPVELSFMQVEKHT